MDRNQFWSIIDKVKNSAEPGVAVAEELGKLPPDEIASYQQHFDALFDDAYRWDLWGAAYLIEGGCSDDGFMDFRYGLIAKGRSVYEKAVVSPDSLADMAGEEIGNELFGYAAMEIYEEKAGQQMPRAERAGSSEPAGEEWDFDDSDECSRRLPNLFRRCDYGSAGADAATTSPGGDSPAPPRKPWWKFW